MSTIDRDRRKLAWVSGTAGDYRLNVRVFAGDYASLDYVAFKTYRAAQDVANFINAQCKIKGLKVPRSASPSRNLYDNRKRKE